MSNNSRLPFLQNVFVNKKGDVCLKYPNKEVTALYAKTPETMHRYVLVTSYLDYSHNVLYYHYGTESLLVQYTKENGKTEAWYYARNNLDGSMYAGRRLNSDEFELLKAKSTNNTS